MGAGDARRGTGARWPSLALRALAALALSLPLALRAGPAAVAAPPPIEPTPADACSPCITVTDRQAWDETVTVVDAAAHDEVVTVVDAPAYTAYRTVVDRPASVVAHHDLVTPEQTVARWVVVSPAHSEPYATWVSSGYWQSVWYDGYWDTFNCHWNSWLDDEVCSERWVDGHWSSSWVDTSHYETAYRWVDDVYGTVYETVPAVYSDWLEALPEITHQEAYTVPALTHTEIVHVAALTHTEVVHHPATTRQVQAALLTESRQSGPRALGTTASGLSAQSAVPPIVIPVVSSVTVVDAAARREAVTVVDVPERSETRAVVVAPAATVIHRELVTPETTLTRSVLVTPETTESVTAWVSSGYWAESCRYSSWIDEEICSERYVDTSGYETTTRSVPATYTTLSEVVPAVYDEWVEVVPEQVATETVTIPAVTHTEFVDRPAVTHTETLEYDAVVGGDQGSGGSDQLAGLAFLLGLSALAGAGRYASARDQVAGALAEWSQAGRPIPADLTPLLAEVSEPAADEHAWSNLAAQAFGPVDLTVSGLAVDGGDVLSGEGPVGPADDAPRGGAGSDRRLAEFDAMLAIQSVDPWDPGGPLDESTRAERRRTIADAKELLLGVTKLSGGGTTADDEKPWGPRRPGTSGRGSKLGPFGMPSLGLTPGGLGVMGNTMAITPRGPNEGTIADPVPPRDPKGLIVADPLPPRDPNEGILGDPVPQRDPREGILADPVWQPGADDGVSKWDGGPVEGAKAPTDGAQDPGPAAGDQQPPALPEGRTAGGHLVQNPWVGDLLSQPTEAGEVLVRAHGEDNQIGSWVARPEDIAGLAAEDIQAKYATPTTPEFVSPVTPPEGTRVQWGEAAPNFDQPGLGWQGQILDRIPEGSYGERIPIGEAAPDLADYFPTDLADAVRLAEE